MPLVKDGQDFYVQCLADCYFATLTREEYSQIKWHLDESEHQTRVQFFQKVPFLQHKFYKDLSSVVGIFGYATCQYGQTLFRNGDPAFNVYIVHYGEFEVLEINQIKSVHQSPISSKCFENSPKGGFGSSLICPKAQKQMRLPRKPIKNDKKIPIDHKVSIVGRYEILGDEDVFSNRAYTTTVRCVSGSGALYTCKGDEFYKLVRSDEKSWKVVRNSFLLRESRCGIKHTAGNRGLNGTHSFGFTLAGSK